MTKKQLTDTTDLTAEALNKVTDLADTEEPTGIAGIYLKLEYALIRLKHIYYNKYNEDY